MVHGAPDPDRSMANQCVGKDREVGEGVWEPVSEFLKGFIV